jgi:hypothetical protein
VSPQNKHFSNEGVCSGREAVKINARGQPVAVKGNGVNTLFLRFFDKNFDFPAKNIVES